MEKRNGKNYKNKEIEEWKNQVLLFDKLSLSEAQDLYKKQFQLLMKH